MASIQRYRTDPQSEYYFKEGCYITEYLNNGADPAVSIARARVTPGRRTRRHRLRGLTERYLILEGEGEALIGGETMRLIAGDVVVIPPETEQCIENVGTKDLIFHAVCTPRFTPEAYQDCDPAAPPT